MKTNDHFDAKFYQFLQFEIRSLKNLFIILFNLRKLFSKFFFFYFTLICIFKKEF